LTGPFVRKSTKESDVTSSNTMPALSVYGSESLSRPQPNAVLRILCARLRTLALEADRAKLTKIHGAMLDLAVAVEGGARSDGEIVGRILAVLSVVEPLVHRMAAAPTH
jgi:hypothetical protein